MKIILLIKYIYFILYMDLSLFENQKYSQNGEDGITIKLIELIYNGNNNNKIYVECSVENDIMCNTRIIRETYNWNGLHLYYGGEEGSIYLKKEEITKENIVELLQKYNVPQNINVLSLDIDFNDFYCLKEILNNYKCDIIICEYNGSHLVNEDKIVIYDKNCRWDGSNYFGASLLSLYNLGEKYNYSLVYCESKGINCFFINNEILQNNNIQINNIGDLTKIYKPANYSSGINGGHTQDIHNREYISFVEAILI